jgi:hypothetical protein
MFKSLLGTKRCVVTLDGFYEFKDHGNNSKQPFYLHHNIRGTPLMFAALYDVWSDKTTAPSDTPSMKTTESSVASVTLLTMDSHSKLHWLHHRQPVILNEETARAWLDPDAESDVVLSQVRQHGRDPPLLWHPVSNQMNKAVYQGKDCSTHIDEVKGSITSFFSSDQEKRSEVKKAKEDEGVILLERQEQEVKVDKVVDHHSVSVKTPRAGWSCSVCTLSNKQRHLRCAACGQPKGSSSAAVASQTTSSSFSLKKRRSTDSVSSNSTDGEKKRSRNGGKIRDFFTRKKKVYRR